MQEIPSEQIRALARKMLTGTITPEEQQILEQWLNANPGNEMVWEQGDADEKELGNRIFRRIAATTGAQKRKRIYWSAAASIVLLVSAGIYFWYPNQKPAAKEVAGVTVPPVEIMPGSDKAILTLGDGRQVRLEGQKIITDGDLQIRNENNELVYTTTSIVSFNTMSTPRGGQYQLRLPDGSRVWLNAASSITYPTAFTGKERVVELSGEAYFEVRSLPAFPSGEGAGKMPFIVKINGMNVNVLGTRFNVMGYDDEAAINTTLLEGAVLITKGNAKALLKPGQEANVNATEEKIKVAAADVEQAIAWKNGMFLFNKTDIKSIMRQLSRWYDFEVRYQNAFENRNFSGMISRKTELSKALKMLEMTKDVKFKIEGRIVTVI
jgi:transmembrane sensor